MPLNTSYIGRCFTNPEPHLVTRDVIRMFAYGICDPNPVYHEVAAARAAGHPDLIAPPTFAGLVSGRVALQLLEDPGFGFDYSRSLHAAQRFRHERPIHAGDELSTELVLEEADIFAGRERVILRSRIQDALKQPVGTVLTTIYGQ
ncbi:FAS1-like dehydratase domain-containing protein [Streptomyces sp. NBC_01353]|uniref:FAS1-like dehydratase domain-containing protein n=1 Tax=Streptomyces sp. NBC_01353 TaxID=2903835 RepID=UPI002E35E529|nr:MaoC family dehydratase N-terminal domain-containing protein [Streptomyces sp. NBC_01353]